MPLRILEQTALVWRRAAKEPERFMSNGRLPAVVEIVLSNVPGGWSVPDNMAALVDMPSDAAVQRCVPQ